MQTAIARADRPVSAASAAIFRMLFGMVATIGAVRFLLKGWVEPLYLQPAHHLTYPWFDWVRPLPGVSLYVYLVVMAILGVCITLGYRYRLAMAAYAVGFTYLELLDAALYLNHYWWVTLASFVMIGLPLHTMWSLDARAGRVARSTTIPSWVLWVLRAQLAVVYLFAGIAKLQSDWIVHALPMRLWLADRTDVFLIGPVLDVPTVAYVASWAGAFFDCTIVGWLLWRRSRPFAYLAVIGFHAVTGLLFQIGIFPWLMIAGTLIFFSPNWPRKLFARLLAFRGLPGSRDEVSLYASAQPSSFATRPWVFCALGIFMVFEIVVPLRHLVYPGDVRWTEEGYYGSWRVMLTEKAATAEFRVHDPESGENWRVEPTSVLTDWQARQAVVRPDLLLTTAHLVADDFAKRGHANVEVRADVFCSFNGRPYQRMIKPDVDLVSIKRGPGHKPFVEALVR